MLAFLTCQITNKNIDEVLSVLLAFLVCQITNKNTDEVLLVFLREN